MEFKLRPAGIQDAARLVEIYAPYVLSTAITFEYDVPSVKEFENRIASITEKYPYIVCESAGKIIAYAYASAFKSRAAYDWSVEMSVYVDQDYRGKGVGRLLYEKLEELLAAQNIRNLYACITVTPSRDSINFHERLGFVQVADFKDCGFKMGKWHEMVWMEKMTGSHDSEPEPVKKWEWI